MKVLLVGNHEFAGVPSMRIFATTLRRELSRLAIDVELIVPRPVFGRIKRSGPASRGGQGRCRACVRSFRRHVCIHGGKQTHFGHLPRYACGSRRAWRARRLAGIAIWAVVAAMDMPRDATGSQDSLCIAIHIGRCEPDS
jgi:hypothetical protein